MGIIQNDELVKVFAERTLGNLTYIEEAEQNGEQVYDATQLINSLLGLIVFPRERDFDSIPTTPLRELEGWPEIHQSKGCNNLRQFCRKLRNAVAHCNILLLGEKVIEGIHFQNIYKGSLTWEHSFSCEEVRQIAVNLNDLLHKEIDGEDEVNNA